MENHESVVRGGDMRKDDHRLHLPPARIALSESYISDFITL